MSYLKNNFQEAKKNLLRYFLFLILLLSYGSLGALLFFYIEECYDVVPKTLTEAEQLLRSLCHNMSTKQHNFNQTTFYHEWTFCLKHRTNSTTEKCELDIRTFAVWLSYTMAVGSTIGYGDVVTRSNTGKVATMIYALPGICLFAATYIPAARALIALTKCALNFIEMNYFKRARISRSPVKVFVVQTILAVLLMLINAWFTTLDKLQNYSFLDAVYFVFISLTTIGFGDFTVDFEKYLSQPHFFIATVFSFSFGLGMFASVVTSLCDVLSKYSARKAYKLTTVQRERRTNKIKTIAVS